MFHILLTRPTGLMVNCVIYRNIYLHDIDPFLADITNLNFTHSLVYY